MMIKTDTWKIAGAKTTGISHEKSLIPCQDAAITYRAKEISCIVVADGAGSRRLSHIGAKSICISISRFLAQNYSRLAGRDHLFTRKKLHDRAYACLKKQAEKYHTDVSAFASTLLFFTSDGKTFIAVQLGDGILAVKYGDGKVEISKDTSKVFANSTSFTTCPNAFYKMTLYRGRSSDISSVIAMTDGAAESLHDRKGNSLSQACSQMTEWLLAYSQGRVTKA